jgi:predicted Zn-dependent protease
MMGPQIAQALQSKHSIYDETEADLSGVQYMHDSGKYNPNGMMTFMQRLAIEENDHPEVELGYLQDHPSSDHRVADIQAKLHALGVPINPRAVSRVLTAVVTDGATSTSAQLQFRQEKTPVLLCLLKATIHGLNAVERARQAAQKINEGIDQKRVLGAMEAREVPEGTEVLWEGTEVLTFAPQDIPSGKTGQDVAKQFIQQIKQTIFADEVARS